MAVGSSAVGTVFTADEFSFGTIDSSPKVITYTETNPGFDSGADTTVTITSVVTGADGVTTITAQFAGSTDPAMNGTFTGTVPGNNEASIILTGSFPGGASTNVYLTNTPSQQPGKFGTAMVATEQQGLTYAPQMVCFASGTLIRTARGDVAVEALVVGDLVVTASGGRRPVRWLGRREVDCRRYPRPHETWPVRIAAQAFGAGLPERDLFLSPGHPVLAGADEDGDGGHLVPIMCLINGTTIDRVPVDHVTYWHVELDQHDIVLAEGLPAESFLDFGNRAWFGAEADAHALANPDFVVPGLGARCRPVAIDGPIVEAERLRLAARFEIGLAAQCAWPLADEMPFGL